VTDPRIYVAIVIGVAATWPALFLYEQVLKLMAFLQDWQEREGGVRYLLLLVSRYAFGILWMGFAFMVFIVLPLLPFPPSHYSLTAPENVYVLSFCCMLFARVPAFYRRMRALGITPEQRLRRRVPSRVIPPRNYSDDDARELRTQKKDRDSTRGTRGMTD